jgi:hypothetical protein
MLNIYVLCIKTVFAFGGAMKRVSVGTADLVETSHAAKSPIKPSSARKFRERKSAVRSCSCILHCSSSGLVSANPSPPTGGLGFDSDCLANRVEYPVQYRFCCPIVRCRFISSGKSAPERGPCASSRLWHNNAEAAKAIFM